MEIKIFIYDPGPFISTINKAIEKIRERDDLNADIIRYFMVQDPKFASFYLLPKIHKRLHMFQVDLLFQTAVVIRKTYLLF